VNYKWDNWTDLRRYPGGNGENYKVPEGQPDYHPNDPTDLDNYINLLSALRTAFDLNGYILSATLPSRQADIDLAYPADKLQQMDPSVDFWNLMSYDHLNRRDNVTDFQAGGDVVADNLATFESRGIALSKINVGFPMYTKYFQLAPGACTESNPIGCPMTVVLENSVGGDTGNSGSLTFNSALNTNASEQAIWNTVSVASGTDNSTALGSVYYDSTSAQFWTWVSPSDIQQTCLKWKGQVGGMMMWSLNQDTNGGSGGPHIQAIADCLA
jgi:chitinase